MSFDIAKTINYWVQSAAYDLETGESLLESKRFPYALYFVHLAIEKILKAIVVKETGEHAPYTHSLILLAKKTGITMTDEMLDRLAEYMEPHIEARYPDENMDFYKKCTEEFTLQKFVAMKEVYKWLIRQLNK